MTVLLLAGLSWPFSYFYPLNFFFSSTWRDRVSFFECSLGYGVPVPECVITQQGAPKVKVQLVWKELRIGKQVPLFAGLQFFTGTGSVFHLKPVVQHSNTVWISYL